MTQKKERAHKNLNIPPENKIILSIDGGGMRGIFTLQLLKKLEEVAESPIYEWCDMVAGTSTGAIICGMILCKKRAFEIEDLYKKLVSRVFTKRNLLAHRFYNPPAFDKQNYRQLLKEIVGDQNLENLCHDTGLDILFTSKDMAAGEETFFTCFNNDNGFQGTYRTALLRAVLEATMSAPTYFLPFERFIDGGTTTFNNPVGAAVLEALVYGGKGKYEQEKLTVFSFGTATALKFIDPSKTKDPEGLDLRFWLNYVMDESSKDASEMQIDVLRSTLLKGSAANQKFDLRRYQLSLDQQSIGLLPDKKIDHVFDTSADWLHQLTNKELSEIDMSDVSKFPLMQTIGEASAEFICPPEEENLLPGDPKRNGNWFTQDLIDKTTGRGSLVTARGDKAAIKSHLSNPNWIDSQPTA